MKHKTQGIKKIFLDNSAVTRPSPRAISSMMPFLTDSWGLFPSPHQVGANMLPAIEQSYRSIYQLLEAPKEDDFVFTSSGAEAVNQVVFSGYYDIYLTTGRNHFLTSQIDEAPAIMAMGRLERMGCVGKMVPASRQGTITVEAVAESITPRTALLSLSWANGLTGVIHPVREIAKLCRERGIRFHLDASHVLGKLFFDPEDIGADLYSFDGSHLHAPQGTGGLLIKNGIKISPLIAGGTEQAGHRAGCLNVAGLVALGAAAQDALESRELVCTEVARLRNQLEKGILSGFPDAQVLFKDQERLPNCTTIAFPGIVNEWLLYTLNRKGVYASIGGGNFQQIGLLLKACGVSEEVSHTALSFSLSRETNEDEIERAIDIIVETVKKLRPLSSNLIKG